MTAPDMWPRKTKPHVLCSHTGKYMHTDVEQLLCLAIL